MVQIEIKTGYKPRPIRFIEIHQQKEWKIKIYSISSNNEYVSQENIELAKRNLDLWLEKSKQYNLPVYDIATLIIHEGKEGCFAIINWWIDENMLQNFVYLNQNKNEFKLYSENGIITCVWEMEVLWHERNAWVNHVLMKNKQPDFDAYLNDHLIQK